MRQIGRFLAGDYTGALCVLASTNLVPIAVAISVGPRLNAYFYMAWIDRRDALSARRQHGDIR